MNLPNIPYEHVYDSVETRNLDKIIEEERLIEKEQKEDAEIEKKELKQEHKRNGGPYSAEQKRKRRNKVYEMHFEKGYSISHIAKTLGYNRNTITCDVAYCTDKMCDEWKKTTNHDWLAKTMIRLENDRTRLYEMLDSTDDKTEKLKIEKSLFSLDAKVSQLLLSIQKQNIHHGSMY